MGAVSPPHTTQSPFKDYTLCFLAELRLQEHLFGDSGFNPNAFVNVTGNRINESTGTVGLVGNANLSVTGNRLNFTIGNVTIVEGTGVNVSGYR